MWNLKLKSLGFSYIQLFRKKKKFALKNKDFAYQNSKRKLTWKRTLLGAIVVLSL